MFFNMANPQTGLKTASGKWTGRFNNPDIELEPGRGMAVWVDEIDTPYTCHEDVPFHFPKSDPFYWFYDKYGLQLTERTPDLTRMFKGRFIYEPNIDDQGIVTWEIDNVAFDEAVLIGNPFLASLDFAAFATLNSGQIKNEYRLAYGVANSGPDSDGKVNEFVTWKSEASVDPLNSYIPPMQSFIVTSQSNAGSLTLKADIKGTSVSETNRILRGTQAALPEEALLISAIRGEHASKTLLLHRGNASHNYIPEEDSYKLFSENDSVSVNIYTRSMDGYALEINFFDNFGQGVPVGIRTVKPGAIRLKFSGMESFGDRTVIYLHDMLTGMQMRLSEMDNEYVFDKQDSELYLENRFFLTFANATDIQLPTVNTNIIVQQLAGQTVRIATDNGSQLGRMQIISIQGQVLVSQEVTESSYMFRAPTPGIYIVRVNETVRKLRVKN
jgi:hypothetical protein